MLANHTYIGTNGRQNAVFPLEYMYLTQGEMQGPTHQGSYAMDFQGYGENGRVYRCNYYAPCDLTMVAISDADTHSYVYTSDEKVNFIDGTSDYLTILVAHDNDSYSIGRHVSQGQLLGKTGTYQGFGDHLHMEVKKGIYEGCHRNNDNVYMLTNSTHIFSLLGVNDTNIIVGGDYNWKSFGDRQYRKNKFPFYLYARKRRNKYIY